jgi:hypothetical protein
MIMNDDLTTQTGTPTDNPTEPFDWGRWQNYAEELAYLTNECQLIATRAAPYQDQGLVLIVRNLVLRLARDITEDLHRSGEQGLKRISEQDIRRQLQIWTRETAPIVE